MFHVPMWSRHFEDRYIYLVSSTFAVEPPESESLAGVAQMRDLSSLDVWVISAYTYTWLVFCLLFGCNISPMLFLWLDVQIYHSAAFIVVQMSIQEVSDLFCLRESCDYWNGSDCKVYSAWGAIPSFPKWSTMILIMGSLSKPVRTRLLIDYASITLLHVSRFFDIIKIFLACEFEVDMTVRIFWIVQAFGMIGLALKPWAAKPPAMNIDRVF